MIVCAKSTSEDVPPEGASPGYDGKLPKHKLNSDKDNKCVAIWFKKIIILQCGYGNL